MKFIIESIEFHTNGGAGSLSLIPIPDHCIFRLGQIDKPRFVNSTVEIVLLNSDDRIPGWVNAFKNKTELEFSIVTVE